MNSRIIALFGAILLIASPAWSSPFDDLSSPSPELRARAAQQIREQHLHPPSSREHWKQVFAIIDGNAPSALEILLSRLPKDGGGFPISRDEFPSEGEVTVPLDLFWAIGFIMHQGRLVRYDIKLREISVLPPPGYSGYWRTFCADVSLVAIYEYQNGRNLGSIFKMR